MFKKINLYFCLVGLCKILSRESFRKFWLEYLFNFAQSKLGTPNFLGLSTFDEDYKELWFKHIAKKASSLDQKSVRIWPKKFDNDEP